MISTPNSPIDGLFDYRVFQKKSGRLFIMSGNGQANLFQIAKGRGLRFKKKWKKFFKDELPMEKRRGEPSLFQKKWNAFQN